MSISRVGQAASWNGTTAIATTTALGMTTNAGDLIVVYAFRNGSTTPPTVGSGYTTVNNPTGANTCSGILAYKVATAGETTVPVFTNCTAIVIAVYRSSTVAAMLVRAAGEGGANNATSISIPAAGTFGHSDGSSARFAAWGHKGATNASTATVPTGFTRITSAGTAGAIWAGELLASTSGAATSMTVTTTGAYRAVQAEIVEAQAFSSTTSEATTASDVQTGALTPTAARAETATVSESSSATASATPLTIYDVGAGPLYHFDAADTAHRTLSGGQFNSITSTGSASAATLTGNNGGPALVTLGGNPAMQMNVNFAYIENSSNASLPVGATACTIIGYLYHQGPDFQSFIHFGDMAIGRNNGHIALPRSGNDIESSIDYNSAGDLVIATFTADNAGNTSQSIVNLWINGVQYATNAIIAQRGTFSGIGFNNNNNDSTHAGAVAIASAFAGVMTTTERQLAEGVLMWQLGQQTRLPSGHPHASAPPTSGGGGSTAYTGSVTEIATIIDAQAGGLAVPVTRTESAPAIDAASATGGTAPTAFRYYRWRITKRKAIFANSIQFSEFQLLDSGGARMAGSATPSIPSGSFGGGGAEGPAQGYDNDTGTKCLDFAFYTNGGSDPDTLIGQTDFILDCGADVTVSGYRWYTANDSTERDPVSWSFATSSDGVTWTVVDTKTDYATTDTRFALVGPFSLGAGGPATYNDSATETASATASQSVSADFAAARAEATTLTEVSAGIFAAVASASEAATASEASFGGSAQSATTSEAASLTDAASIGTATPAAANEAATVTDAASTVTVFAIAVSEPLTAIDTRSSVLSANASVSESSTATEGSFGGNAQSGSVSETASVTDGATSVPAIGGSVSETVIADDARAAVLMAAAVITESAPASESMAGILSMAATRAETATVGESSFGGQQQLASLSEAVVLGDAATYTYALGEAITEAVALADASVTTAILGATITETSVVFDLALAGATLVAARAEGAPATDAAILGLNQVAGAAEAASAVESAVSSLLAQAGILEAGSAFEVIASGWTGFISVSEQASATDAISYTLIQLTVPRSTHPISLSGSSRRISLVGDPLATVLTGSSRRPLIGVEMKTDFALYIGETWTIDGVARAPDGTPIDITNATIEFRICSKTALLVKLVSPTDVAIVDGPAGKYTITLPDEDPRQDELAAGVFDHEVDVLSVNSVSVQNVGEVTLKKSLRKRFPGSGSTPSGTEPPTPPTGYDLLTNSSGAYLVDSNGNYLIGAH